MAILAPTRDEKLLDGIVQHHYLRTDQAAELFFQSIKDPLQRRRKAAARLLTLYRRKQVQRFRFPGEPFIYTVSGTKYSPKILHYLAITDVLLEVLSIIPNQSRIEYEIEVRQGSSITDCIINYHNAFRGISGELHIEVELENSQDIVSRMEKYEDILEDRPNAQLLVVCKHRRTVDRLRNHDFDFPLQAIDIHYIKEQFTLGGNSFK